MLNMMRIKIQKLLSLIPFINIINIAAVFFIFLFGYLRYFQMKRGITLILKLVSVWLLLYALIFILQKFFCNENFCDITEYIFVYLNCLIDSLLFLKEEETILKNRK